MSLDINALADVCALLHDLSPTIPDFIAKMGRGASWTGPEEVAACRAALRASENPIVGADQKKETFESRVHDEFCRLIPKGDGEAKWPSRSPRAVLRQWKSVKAACLKMYSRLETVRAADLTGEPTERDIWRVAVMMFNKRGSLGDAYSVLKDESFPICPEFPHKAAFYFLDSTSVLSDGVVGGDPWSPSMEANESRPVVENDLNLGNLSDEEEDKERAEAPSQPTEGKNAGKVPSRVGKRERVLARPVGSKRAKLTRTKEESLSRMAGSYAEMAKSGKQRAQTRAAELKLRRQELELNLFSQPGTDPKLRSRFLSLLQKRALNNLEKELGEVQSLHESSKET